MTDPPTTAAEWLAHADWLETPEGRTTWAIVPCPRCKDVEAYQGQCAFKQDRTILLAYLQPPHQARLTGWLMQMLDERWHGMEPCVPCGEAGCDCYKLSVPTFAMLFDRPYHSCRCGHDGPAHSGRPGEKDTACTDCECEAWRPVTIPGHLSQFAAMLAAAGDPRAEQVRGLSVCKWHFPDRWDVWCSVTTTASQQAYPTYPDACREVLRRLKAMFTEPCPCPTPNPPDHCEPLPDCQHCNGLGWRVTLAKEVQP